MTQHPNSAIRSASTRWAADRAARHRVVIIGAGFSGIGAAIRLLEAGVDDIVILERGMRAGGTWRDNTYPGAACDVPSVLYSYSFMPNPDWRRVYAEGPEILNYIDQAIAKYRLADRIRFGHEVTALQFDEPTGHWTVSVTTPDGGRELLAQSVVVASGPLSHSSFPDIDGIDDFNGHLMHSAEWDHDFDFNGRSVAVVGTGASAVQIVPELVKQAAKVTVFQRTPGWVLPRLNYDAPAWQRSLFQNMPVAQHLMRASMYWLHEAAALAIVWPTPLTRVVEVIAKLNLRRQIRDQWTRRQLTPRYRAGCKRLLSSNDYLAALAKDNSKLITWPIVRLTETGILTAEGVVHACDAVVFATGFDVKGKTGTPFPVTGLDGRVLGQEWSSGAFAYKSVNVAGYPNLHFTFGPNSGPGHNSALLYMEAQLEYIVEAVKMLSRWDLRYLDVRSNVQDAFNADLQDRLRRTTWSTGCSSWYLTPDGFNATMYPGFATQYRRQMQAIDMSDYHAVR